MIRVRVVVLNTIFNNISVISLRSVFLMEENRSTRRKPPTCCKSRDKLYHRRIEYTSPWTRFDLKTLVVIGTDYIGSYKSNYHTIMTTTVLYSVVRFSIKKNTTKNDTNYQNLKFPFFADIIVNLKQSKSRI